MISREIPQREMIHEPAQEREAVKCCTSALDHPEGKAIISARAWIDRRLGTDIGFSYGLDVTHGAKRVFVKRIHLESVVVFKLQSML